MLSFDITAIDIILVIAVAVLLILYMKKLSMIPEKPLVLSPLKEVPVHESRGSSSQMNCTECPRGYGNIRMLGADNSVSDKCLGCYMIMECYSQNE